MEKMPKLSIDFTYMTAIPADKQRLFDIFRFSLPEKMLQAHPEWGLCWECNKQIMIPYDLY